MNHENSFFLISGKQRTTTFDIWHWTLDIEPVTSNFLAFKTCCCCCCFVLNIDQEIAIQLMGQYLNLAPKMRRKYFLLVLFQFSLVFVTNQIKLCLFAFEFEKKLEYFELELELELEFEFELTQTNKQTNKLIEHNN